MYLDSSKETLADFEACSLDRLSSLRLTTFGYYAGTPSHQRVQNF
jgi:hypothetical protein